MIVLFCVSFILSYKVKASAQVYEASRWLLAPKHKETLTMVKPSCRTDSPTYQNGYQQAKEDFAIPNLLASLKTYSDADFKTAWINLTQPELESLAAILIRELTTNLNGKAMADYFNAMGIGSANISPSLVQQAFPSPSLDLPGNFPNVGSPRYLYGDKLRWICDDDKADRGVAIGRFYSFAPHQCAWTWCYLIWLDKNSPSSTRIVADIAWEDDLEPVDQEKIS